MLNFSSKIDQFGSIIGQFCANFTTNTQTLQNKTSFSQKWSNCYRWVYPRLGKHLDWFSFNLTDQRRISFMFDNSRISKIKNTKIARWRLELSQNKYDVSYGPTIENHTADTFSRESLQFVTHYGETWISSSVALSLRWQWHRSHHPYKTLMIEDEG